jgi:hypothetical protein
MSVLLPGLKIKPSIKQAASRANLKDGVLIGLLFNPNNYYETSVNF